MTRRNPAYNRAVFMLSVASYPQLPSEAGSEVAFCGRSNVGKSSAINAITGIGGLARVSKTPGRTQQLNFFRIDDERRIVDLPGYGYARVPAEVKRRWDQLLEQYLRSRRSLRGVILLMDIRHPLTDFDRQMLAWCQLAAMPVHILLTKADKLGRGAINTTIAQVSEALKTEFDLPVGVSGVGGVTLQAFSAAKRTGIDDVHTVLDRWLGFEQAKKTPVRPREEG